MRISKQAFALAVASFSLFLANPIAGYEADRELGASVMTENPYTIPKADPKTEAPKAPTTVGGAVGGGSIADGAAGGGAAGDGGAGGDGAAGGGAGGDGAAGGGAAGGDAVAGGDGSDAASGGDAVAGGDGGDGGGSDVTDGDSTGILSGDDSSGGGDGPIGFIRGPNAQARTGTLAMLGSAVAAGAVIAAVAVRRRKVVVRDHPLKGALNRRIELFSHLAEHHDQRTRPPRRYDEDTFYKAEDVIAV